MNVILIGPPLCGKGTQAKLLKEKFNLIHLSTGEMLREISSHGTKLANEIKSLIDNGHFVSDELIIEVVKNKLDDIKSQYDNNSQYGLLFDGFPRTVAQAKALENILKIDYILEIVVSKEEIAKRVINRASCSGCGKAYLLSNIKTDICEVCGEKITQRKDDTIEIAQNRYDEYMAKTYPIIEYFKNNIGYHKIDGEKSTEMVFDQICKVLK